VSSANRAPHPSSLADVLDLVLDKGIVIDAYVRLALVGIEILTLDARVVIASVDTYLRFAEAVNRLDIQPQQQPVGLPGLVEELRGGGGNGHNNGAPSTDADSSAKQVEASQRGGDKDDEPKPAARSRGSSGRTRRPARRSRQES
jgi:hypothetical protein